jgi:alkylation response protein AidB-like acyl-CoA dehydrogenase
MSIALEQAQAMGCVAAMVCELDASISQTIRQHRVSAAKVTCAQAARSVAYSAIQLHGATGITDARIGALIRLIVHCEKRGGDTHYHLTRMENLKD